MPAYLVTDKVENKRTLVEAASAPAAERRVSGERYETENIKDPIAFGKLQSEGVEFISAEAESSSSSADNQAGNEGQSES